MSEVLSSIAAAVRKKVEGRKQILSLERLKKEFPLKRAPLGFFRFFQTTSPGIIAEIKYKSPSEGSLQQALSPIDVAAAYVKNGARALSVLTEEEHFGGKIANLVTIRREFPRIPLLMKDFFIDEYQIYEAARAGADAILLIAALLDSSVLAQFMRTAESLGLESLVEVHDENEMEAARNVRAHLIGVNNRNLKTLEVSLETAHRLASVAPGFSTLICESGISTPGQIKELGRLGYKGFLVGTTLMKSGAPGAALAQLLKGKP